MKILFYSDVHIKDYGSYPGFNVADTNGLTKELNNTLQAFYFISDYIKNNQVDLVINCGDTFNVTDYVTTKTLKVASIGLSLIRNRCKEKGIDHLILVGNHEYLNEHLNIHNCDILREYTLGNGNCLIDEYVEYKSNGTVIALFPYSSDINKIYNWMVEGQKNARIICTHLNFTGACYENNAFSTANLLPESKVPIISGDIHLPQQVKDVTYVGSVIQGKFAQYKLNNNGIMIYDTNTLSYERVFNSYSKHYVKVREENISIVNEKLKPQNVILQIAIQDKSKIEQYNQQLKGFEYFFTSSHKEQKTMMDNKIYSEFNNIDPKLVLNKYISDNNEKAIEVFEEIFS